MKLNSFHGDFQSPSVGLRQGCPLSATLLGLFSWWSTQSSSIFQARCRYSGSALEDHWHRICWWCHVVGQLTTSARPHQCHGRILWIVTHADQCCQNDGVGRGAKSYLHVYKIKLEQGSTLEQVARFKYLGLNFDELGHISPIITPILDKAVAAWAVVQNKHAQLHLGDTVKLKFCLF